MGLPEPYFQDEHCTIYHGDCRELLPDLSADVIITDPPYGVEFEGKQTKSTKRRGQGYLSLVDSAEYVTDVVVPLVQSWVDQGMRIILTPGSRNMFAYPKPDAVGTIFFPAGAGFGRWGFTCSQPIFYYGRDPYLATGQGQRPDSFASTESAPDNGHPCPKPINTMRWLVTKGSLPGETILDPFMGSGTTLRAAKDLGRKAIGIEIEERYCEIAAKRLQQSVLPLEIPA
jgi:site-specific DNA-methyltransferase (adenine-specific)